MRSNSLRRIKLEMGVMGQWRKGNSSHFGEIRRYGRLSWPKPGPLLSRLYFQRTAPLNIDDRTVKGLKLNSNPVSILCAMQHKDQERTSGPVGHNAHVHSWKRSQMTQVKLASGWPPAQHFHFSKILFLAHLDLFHDSLLKLDSFFKSISIVSFVSYPQVGFHCDGGICTHTWNEELAVICSERQLVELSLFGIFPSTIRKDRK